MSHRSKKVRRHPEDWFQSARELSSAVSSAHLVRDRCFVFARLFWLLGPAPREGETSFFVHTRLELPRAPRSSRLPTRMPVVCAGISRELASDGPWDVSAVFGDVPVVPRTMARQEAGTPGSASTSLSFGRYTSRSCYTHRETRLFLFLILSGCLSLFFFKFCLAYSVGRRPRVVSERRRQCHRILYVCCSLGRMGGSRGARSCVHGLSEWDSRDSIGPVTRSRKEKATVAA